MSLAMTRVFLLSKRLQTDQRGSREGPSMYEAPVAVTDCASEYEPYANASISALRRATVELLNPTCLATLLMPRPLLRAVRAFSSAYERSA